MTVHIKDIHDDSKSWCGETLGNEFYFKSVDHAVLNGMPHALLSHVTPIITCADCTQKIIDKLICGRDRNGSVENE